MINNLFYFNNINSIGGVESFFYYLAEKYCEWDIVVFYRTGDQKQIERLRKFVKVKKFNNEKIQCKKAFFNYATDIINFIDAEEYIQIIHADYDGMKLAPNYHDKITRFIGVSEQVCRSFKKLTGFEIELSYNPIQVKKPQKILRLISATRLTAEKGKKRIIKLAEILDANGILYEWTIFTNDQYAIQNDNIIYRQPRLDIIDYIADADYLVQLSDNEGYCYSVVEALTVGTPVIVTDCPVFRELGVNEKNGFILDFDLSDVPVKAIYKGLPKIKYQPKADRWSQILAEGESQYKKDMQTQVCIRCIQDYYDLQINKPIKNGELIKVSKVRAEMIIESGFAEYLRGGG